VLLRPRSLQANLFLLATCYHRSNQSYRAYHLLKGLAGDQSRYLYALCALQLGKLTEAETALLPDNDAKRVGGWLDGAAGCCLGAGMERGGLSPGCSRHWAFTCLPLSGHAYNPHIRLPLPPAPCCPSCRRLAGA
jgi:hypothetical protein